MHNLVAFFIHRHILVPVDVIFVESCNSSGVEVHWGEFTSCATTDQRGCLATGFADELRYLLSFSSLF